MSGRGKGRARTTLIDCDPSRSNCSVPGKDGLGTARPNAPSKSRRSGTSICPLASKSGQMAVVAGGAACALRRAEVCGRPVVAAHATTPHRPRPSSARADAGAALRSGREAPPRIARGLLRSWRYCAEDSRLRWLDLPAGRGARGQLQRQGRRSSIDDRSTPVEGSVKGQGSSTHSQVHEQKSSTPRWPCVPERPASGGGVAFARPRVLVRQPWQPADASSPWRTRAAAKA